MVIVVGTSHPVQMATEVLNAEAGEELMAFLENLCRTREIRAVAEEMSAEALAENGCLTSIPMRLAHTLRVEHRFCDPDRSERGRLGIRQENDIRAKAISGWSESEISSSILAENAKREQYWLNQLRTLNRWPVLFICGANHVVSFRSILEQEDLTVCVAVEDWTPNDTVKRDARESDSRSSP